MCTSLAESIRISTLQQSRRPTLSFGSFGSLGFFAGVPPRLIELPPVSSVDRAVVIVALPSARTNAWRLSSRRPCGYPTTGSRHGTMPALWTGYRYRGGVALHGAADDRIRKLSATARALSWNAGRPRRLDCSVVLDAEGDTIARDQPL